MKTIFNALWFLVKLSMIGVFLLFVLIGVGIYFWSQEEAAPYNILVSEKDKPVERYSGPEGSTKRQPMMGWSLVAEKGDMLIFVATPEVQAFSIQTPVRVQTPTTDTIYELEFFCELNTGNLEPVRIFENNKWKEGSILDTKDLTIHDPLHNILLKKSLTACVGMKMFGFLGSLAR
jgi:hypothetical protein